MKCNCGKKIKNPNKVNRLICGCGRIIYFNRNGEINTIVNPQSRNTSSGIRFW